MNTLSPSLVAQRNALYTFFSFMNVQKYPPSLCICARRSALEFCSWHLWECFEKWSYKIYYGLWSRPISDYILHFFLIHLVSAICYLSRAIHWQRV